MLKSAPVARFHRIASALKVVLLPVHAPEGPIAGGSDRNGDHGPNSLEFNVLEGKVSCLERISESNPREVSGSKDVTKPVGRDVHNCEDGRLFVVRMSVLPG